MGNPMLRIFLQLVLVSSNGTNNPPVYWDKIIFKFRTGSYSPEYIYDRKDATTRITTAGSSTIYTFYWEAGTIGYDGTGPIYWNNNNLDTDSSIQLLLNLVYLAILLLMN